MASGRGELPICIRKFHLSPSEDLKHNGGSVNFQRVRYIVSGYTLQAPQNANQMGQGWRKKSRIEVQTQMKTLNNVAVVFFLVVFGLALIGTFNLLEATVFAVAVSVPLYLMGLGLRWFVRGLVR